MYDDPCPYAALAIAVIRQAYKDAAGEEGTLIQRDAQLWLTEPNQDFTWWCEALDMDDSVVRAQAVQQFRKKDNA